MTIGTVVIEDSPASPALPDAPGDGFSAASRTLSAEAADPDAYDEPTCWECGGPVLYYAGSVHGWRCRGCLNRYLDAAAARAEAKEAKERAKLARKNHHDPAARPERGT